MRQSIAATILEGATVLREAGIAEARCDAGSLLASVIQRDRGFMITHADDPLVKEDLETFRQFITRRAAGEPLQYITGHQEFYKLDFEVTPDVLIPRPETELIVETALEMLSADPEAYILDVGTGSGCIAISLLSQLPRACAVATDISRAALSVADRNAGRHGVSDRLVLIESDCCTALDANETFSLIVSNPPYIAEGELKVLQREVREHEPCVALTCGADGLAVIKRLLNEALPCLRPGGHLVLEIGFGQSDRVRELIDLKVWELIEIKPDLRGIPRTVVIRKKQRF
jgi:release factor glutamine methyltransferase